jgi:hypothetical protein
MRVSVAQGLLHGTPRMQQELRQLDLQRVSLDVFGWPNTSGSEEHLAKKCKADFSVRTVAATIAIAAEWASWAAARRRPCRSARATCLNFGVS